MIWKILAISEAWLIMAAISYPIWSLMAQESHGRWTGGMRLESIGLCLVGGWIVILPVAAVTVLVCVFAWLAPRTWLAVKYAARAIRRHLESPASW